MQHTVADTNKPKVLESSLKTPVYISQADTSSDSFCPVFSMRNLLKLLLLSVGVALFSSYSSKRKAKSGELPDVYGLCSQGKAAIYTVDSTDSKVQCILVKYERILKTGCLGK